MYEVILSDVATADLIGIVEFIAKYSVSKAYNCKNEILSKLEKLSVDPLMGTPSKLKRLKGLGYRFLVIKNHLAHYQMDKINKCVNIIRILHGAMNQEKHLGKDVD